MTRLMDRAWFRNGIAPIAVGIVILAAWQAFVVYRKIPVYLFPAPSDIGASLAANLPVLLMGALQHVEGHVPRLHPGGGDRHVHRLSVRAEPRWLRCAFSPMR